VRTPSIADVFVAVMGNPEVRDQKSEVRAENKEALPMPKE